MSALDTRFAELRAAGRKALMPFITAGDPDLDFTAAVLRELAARGCSLCELGIPYSDPIADGPVIQDSYTRALARGIQLSAVWDMLGRTLPGVKLPVVTMVSAAIVMRQGVRAYVQAAQAAGVAGAIVPDLPADESAELVAEGRRQDFAVIHLVTPNTPRDRALRIAERSTGFLYYVSVTGITGERAALPPGLVENVAWLRTRTPLPICVGFGVSTPEHVRQVAAVADGVIVGSAVVRRMAAAAQGSREAALRDVGQYVSELLRAL